MTERLLVCDDCGNEAYLNPASVQRARRDGYECEECGSHTHQDFGDVEIPHDCAELLTDMDYGQVDLAVTEA